MSQIQNQLDQVLGGLHPAHAKSCPFDQEDALPPALHWDLSCMGTLKLSVRPQQEISSVWDSVNMRNFPNHQLHYGSHARKRAWKLFQQLRKNPDLHKRTLSWDKDNFGPNSSLA